MYKIVETNGKVRSGKVDFHEAIEVYAELVACGVDCKLVRKDGQEVSKNVIGVATRYLMGQFNDRITNLEYLREFYGFETYDE
jgi:hypothetical protein